MKVVASGSRTGRKGRYVAVRGGRSLTTLAGLKNSGDPGFCGLLAELVTLGVLMTGRDHLPRRKRSL